jgi:hypothetical protein
LSRESPPLESLKPQLEAQTSRFWEHCSVGGVDSYEDIHHVEILNKSPCVLIERECYIHPRRLDVELKTENLK